MRKRRIPSKDELTPTTPLRLDVAAAVAFPDGSMGASGLRLEAARGRLAVERIAGKDYTTLKAIEEMRERCRVQPKAAVSTSTRKSTWDLSETERASVALAAARMSSNALRQNSRPTSRKNTSQSATIVPVASSSRTS